jgi:hypothetical protein
MIHNSLQLLSAPFASLSSTMISPSAGFVHPPYTSNPHVLTPVPSLLRKEG